MLAQRFSIGRDDWILSGSKVTRIASPDSASKFENADASLFLKSSQLFLEKENKH